jgi:hypothetical protein
MKEDSRWCIATAEDGANTVVFRIRIEPPAFAKQAEFPHLLVISWPFDAAENNGMPSPLDAERMSELEDLLDAGLESPRAAFLTAAVTGNGVREWQWYARNRDTVMELINKTLGELGPFPIEISLQDDPEWQGYNGIRESFSGKE